MHAIETMMSLLEYHRACFFKSHSESQTLDRFSHSHFRVQNLGLTLATQARHSKLASHLRATHG